MATNAKPRQPRLRASCDGCFLAKVKCSKARPICSRCLACGLECRYSPSSRTIKLKSDDSHNHTPSPGDLDELSPLRDDRDMAAAYSSDNGPPSLYKLDTGTGWNTPPSVDASMSRNPSMGPSMGMPGVESQMRRDHEMAMGLYGGTLPWASSTPLTTAPYDTMAMSVAQMPPHTGRSASMEASMLGHMRPSWADSGASQENMMYSSPTSLPTPGSLGFPSPSATPTLQYRHKQSQANGTSGGGGSCTCFTLCLQSLQALHNASSPVAPPFDLVLSLNRKAVEGCAAMLSCSRCMNRSGTHTSAMLLGTIIGKITSFYKNATQTYFESMGGTMSGGGSGQIHLMQGQNGNMNQAPGLGVSLGTYTLGGEEGRWLELQILERELRKLEEVYAQFREVCADLSEDAEVSRAMIGYLNNTIESTLHVIGHGKGAVPYC